MSFPKSPEFAVYPVAPRWRMPLWVRLCLWGLSSALILIFIVELRASLQFGRRKAWQAYCVVNVRKLAQGVGLYTQDYDQTLPMCANWMDAIEPTTKSAGDGDKPALFHCPEIAHSGPDVYGYAWDSRLSGLKLADIPDSASGMLFYDSQNMERNASDPGTSVDKRRHVWGYCVGYLDGHGGLVETDESKSESARK